MERERLALLAFEKKVVHNDSIFKLSSNQESKETQAMMGFFS